MNRTIATTPVSTWALFGAGIALSGMIVGAVLILWLGGWEASTALKRIDYIGALAVMTALDLMAVIASLAKARLAAKGPGNMSIDVSTTQDTPQPVVTTTTVTEVKPKETGHETQ